jgi:peptide/nickel transport system substrate-binding protein
MKRFVWQWLAVSSILISTVATGETRPQYGGTLHVAMRAAPTSLDPDAGQTDSIAQRGVASLLFDTLVTVDTSGRLQPGLAESWLASKNNQRWQFRIRRGVTFHDGTPLTAENAAASLRVANPSWNITTQSDALTIECDSDPELPAELALARNAIAKRDAEKLSGTGAFRIADWQPGKKLTLAANEDYWRGRPFLDSIEIEMGKSFRDQLTALELGRTDLVEVAPEQAHRESREKYGLLTSEPIVLLGLLFMRDAASADEQALRTALSLSVERGSIRSVLLQGAGQPAASILPTWISGYGFVFSTDADLAKARQLRAQVRTAPASTTGTWTVGYDANDPLARLLAERIALNARDAGLSLQPTASAAADLRVVEIPLVSLDPWIALDEVKRQLGLPAVKNNGGSIEDLYAAEQAFLATRRLIPLFHLPFSYAYVMNLNHLRLRSDGSWDLADAWLESTRP